MYKNAEFLIFIYKIHMLIFFKSKSSNVKTDCHDITEIVLKVALNTIKPNLIVQI
jgi:hypothetical protein